MSETSRKRSEATQRRGGGPASTESPRLQAIHRELDGHLRSLFPDVEGVFDYGMHGWRVPRRKRVDWTKGTMDPNWLLVGVAERKQGITLHVWNPTEYDCLARRRQRLQAAGFKVMVGCLQFNRKSDYPIAEVKGLLTEVKARMDAEA